MNIIINLEYRLNSIKLKKNGKLCNFYMPNRMLSK